MQRKAIRGLSVLIGAVLISAGLAHARGAGIVVKPASGTGESNFTVTFTAPERVGPSGSTVREYLISVTRPAKSGCQSGASVPVRRARAHARMRARLSPSRGDWCPGLFVGRIEELQFSRCPPFRVCPEYVSLVRTVGHFRFRVGAPRAVDRMPPRFAGLRRAFACTPGPQRPGQTTPFTLSWEPATDNRTPSAHIVYDIYESSTSGGERFSHPSWRTTPGVTSFRTPGLPSHGSFYFVVRARDRAGNEDRNRVERRGQDPCV